MSATGACGTQTAAPEVERRTRTIGVFCGMVVILLFSSFTLVSRLGFASSLKLADIAALRFVIAGVLMLPVLLHYGLSDVRWRDAAALAFTGGFGFALCAYTGFSLAPASHGAVLLHGTLPLFTFALAWRFSSAIATRRRVLGLATILLGIIAMAWDSLTGSTVRQLLGDGALLLASISWSAYGLLARRQGLPPAHSASIVAVFSLCVFLPVYLVLPGSTVFTIPWRELVLQGVFQGVLIGALSVFVYSQAVAALGVVQTALLTAAVPCLTTIAAVFLLGEIPSAVAWSGVVVVTVGMALSLNSESRTDAARAVPHQPDDFFTKYARASRRGGPGDDAYQWLAQMEEERSWWGKSR